MASLWEKYMPALKEQDPEKLADIYRSWHTPQEVRLRKEQTEAFSLDHGHTLRQMMRSEQDGVVKYSLGENLADRKRKVDEILVELVRIMHNTMYNTNISAEEYAKMNHHHDALLFLGAPIERVRDSFMSYLKRQNLSDHNIIDVIMSEMSSKIYDFGVDRLEERLGDEHLFGDVVKKAAHAYVSGDPFKAKMKDNLTHEDYLGVFKSASKHGSEYFMKNKHLFDDISYVANQGG